MRAADHDLINGSKGNYEYDMDIDNSEVVWVASEDDYL